MAISENKTRIQISLGNDLLSVIDEFCEVTGMSRSNYIAFIVSQNVYAQKALIDKASEVLHEERLA